MRSDNKKITENQQEIPQDFLKQRRNLMIACFINLLIQHGDTDIKEIKIIGLAFKFHNEDTIFILLLAVLIYFSVRYMQFFFEIPEKGFSEPFSRRVYDRCQEDINSLIKNNFPKNIALIDFKINTWSFMKFSFLGELHMESNRRFEEENEQKEPIENKFETINIDILVRDYFFTIMQSFIGTTFKTTSVTNYYLPIFIALSTYVYLLYRHLSNAAWMESLWAI